ncbi:HWE histidine kinase domain-containing protein [Aureimonas ureilytica]|uniref:HWE histidine kinase domain-containing protein n=1 Tax=Aureimonas ureilytica TaxID=401562 RepID=UPI000A8E353A|nr:HWE histidine kinase domain-containing protein [Aureimonas ureilytica]
MTDVEYGHKAEEQLIALNHELAHRLKNTLAVVQSIANQTLRSAPDMAVARDTLTKRIQALSRAHDLLLTGKKDAGAVEAIKA